MFWKKKTNIWTDLRPMPECGNKEEHYFWEDGSKWTMPCPICLRQKQTYDYIMKVKVRQDNEAAEKEELVELIANRVIEKLNLQNDLIK